MFQGTILDSKISESDLF